MAIFNSFLYVYQRVTTTCENLLWIPSPPVHGVEVSIAFLKKIMAVLMAEIHPQ